MDVPRLRKTEWPAHITNALGIPNIQGSAGPWVSKGDTTDVAWFHAMCGFVGVRYPGERIRAMKAIFDAVGADWDQARHSSKGAGKKDGGNVRTEAFVDLWIALHESRFLDEHHRPSLADDSLLSEGEEEGLPRQQFTYQHIRLRLGQAGFRQRLLTVYEGRCAVTGGDIPETLEAAHIQPHASGGRMTTSNGLLLRADIHTLFDLGLIAIDPTNWSVLMHPSISRTDTGKGIRGRKLRLPVNPSDHPCRMSLDQRRVACGL
jgi:hypothetical protein